jgi:hypothetical protein
MQHDIKKNSKTMNYLIILIKFKVSRFLCRSVYNKQIFPNPQLFKFTTACFLSPHTSKQTLISVLPTTTISLKHVKM